MTLPEQGGFNERLDEILEQLITDASSTDWQATDYDGLALEAKQAILDWHNKRIEAVLDRLEKQAKSLIRNPDGSSIGAEYIPLSAIEAERNKLKEES